MGGDLQTALSNARVDDPLKRQDLKIGFQKPPPTLDIHSKAAAWAWLAHGLGKQSPVPNNNTRVSRTSSRFKAEATKKPSKKWDPKQRLFDQYELSLIAKSFQEAAVSLEAKQAAQAGKRTMKKKKKKKENAVISCFAMLSRPLQVASNTSKKKKKSSPGAYKDDDRSLSKKIGPRKSTKVSDCGSAP